MGTGALVSFPGVSLPAPLAVSRDCGTGWGGEGREASVCLALPPTLKNEGWKLIFGEGDRQGLCPGLRLRSPPLSVILERPALLCPAPS